MRHKHSSAYLAESRTGGAFHPGACAASGGMCSGLSRMRASVPDRRNPERAIRGKKPCEDWNCLDQSGELPGLGPGQEMPGMRRDVSVQSYFSEAQSGQTEFRSLCTGEPLHGLRMV